MKYLGSGYTYHGSLLKRVVARISDRLQPEYYSPDYSRKGLLVSRTVHGRVCLDVWDGQGKEKWTCMDKKSAARTAMLLLWAAVAP